MYILFEGMPCTGKTTVARALTESTGGRYLKSVISQTEFGEIMKNLRRKDDKTLEYFYLIDGLLDELRVRDILSAGEDLIRDKCFVSSMAHIYTHGVLNNTELYRSLITKGYADLSHHVVQPDLVVLMMSDYDKIKEKCVSKDDLSHIDEMLISDEKKYFRQNDNLKYLLEKIYKDKLIVLYPFDHTIEESCEIILNEYKKRVRKL